jgi:hypothetical protein
MITFVLVQLDLDVWFDALKYCAANNLNTDEFFSKAAQNLTAPVQTAPAEDPAPVQTAPADPAPADPAPTDAETINKDATPTE